MEDVSDFHIRKFEFFSKEEHRNLAWKRSVAGLRFTKDVFLFDAKNFGYGEEYFVRREAVFLVLFDESIENRFYMMKFNKL